MAKRAVRKRAVVGKADAVDTVGAAAGLRQANEADLAAAGAAPLLKWDVTLDGLQIPVGTNVSGDNGFYQVNGGPLLINTNQWAVFLRYCNDDFDVNLPRNSPALVVPDPHPVQMQGAAPIQLNFASPLSALGARLSVEGDTITPNLQLLGILWVQVVGSTQWQPVSAGGLTGLLIEPGAAQTAPVVGVVAVAAKIEKVRFDAKLMGNRTFRSLVLSELVGLP